MGFQQSASLCRGAFQGMDAIVPMEAKIKVKRMGPADCVVGGFCSTVLLDLFDEAHLLEHVGHCPGRSALD